MSESSNSINQKINTNLCNDLPAWLIDYFSSVYKLLDGRETLEFDAKEFLNSSGNLELDKKIFGALEWVKERSNGEMRQLSLHPGLQPYWTHLWFVANLVRASGTSDEEMVLSACLHDIIEDGGVSFAEVSKSYGENVAHIVSLLTKPSENYDENEYYAKLKNAEGEIGRKARIIKVLDRCINAYDMSVTNAPKWDKEKRLKYIEEAEKGIVPLTQNLDLKFGRWLGNSLDALRSSVV